LQGSSGVLIEILIFREYYINAYSIYHYLQPVLKTQERITNHKSVDVFLSSMLRNSIKSKLAYQFGLAHFQKFIVLEYTQYDIETILKPLSKFRRKVKMPKLYREDEEPLDVSDIRKILLSCNNR
jgi:hypothetical protein